MKGSNKKETAKKRLTKFNVYPVPFALGETEENLTIFTNISRYPSKEEIISQALMLHSKGDISEAAKYYQYFLDQGFSDSRVFCNYGMILSDLGKLVEAETLLRTTI